MGNLQNGSQASRIENFSFGAKGINYPDKLIHYGYHGLLVAPELFVLLLEIGPKAPFPFHYPHRHLKQDVSQVRVALLGNTHLHFPFAGLFGHGVGSRVFDELFSAGKSLYLSHLGQKPGCKAWRDSLDGRKISELVSLGLIDLIFQELFKLLDSGLQEEELFHIESEDFFEPEMGDTDGVSSQRDYIMRREGKSSSRAGFLHDFSNFGLTGPGDGMSRGIKGKDGKEGLGEDHEIGFSLREEDGQGLFDLSFGFRDFLFEFFDLSGDELGLRGDGGRGKEVGVRESEEGQDESVLFVGLGGIVGRDESAEAVNHFGVEDEDVEAVGEQEGEKRDVKSAGRFKDKDVRGELRSYFQELGKAFSGHREGFGSEDSSILIEDAEIERVFRDIYADEVHGFTSGLRFLSLVSILPGGRGFYAQPTYRELRDRGTDSYRGFEAYGKWSPCPSINLSLGVFIT